MGSDVFSSFHLFWERKLLVPRYPPAELLIHLHTAPYEFIALSPGLQKIIQDYSKRGREGGGMYCAFENLKLYGLKNPRLSHM